MTFSYRHKFPPDINDSMATSATLPSRHELQEPHLTAPGARSVSCGVPCASIAAHILSFYHVASFVKVGISCLHLMFLCLCVLMNLWPYELLTLWTSDLMNLWPYVLTSLRPYELMTLSPWCPYNLMTFCPYDFLSLWPSVLDIEG